MALIVDALIEILRKPTIGGIAAELAAFAAPIWVAALLGLMVGWAWRPRWAAGLVGEKSESSGDSLKAQPPGYITSLIPEQSSGKEEKLDILSSPPQESEKLSVTGEDLKYLSALVEEEDGGPAWIQMMDKNLPSMSYRAWRRDVENGPPQYRSGTVFEDASPETVRDFFWDDEFRMKSKWDDMLLHHSTLEECSVTGTMVVHWIRKFPFFCSNREYTIGRRIWNVDGAYYCVTKGVPCPSIPRQNKPRRVDLYYSSWCIRAVESRRGDGRMTACEVLLFHYEDMGIPWEIAKLGVRQGMWGCVKKIEPGLRAYQAARNSGDPPSRSAAIARINARVPPGYLRSLGCAGGASSDDIMEADKEKPFGSRIPKFLIVGGAIALACTLDRGLLTKALIFGVARRFAKMGRRL